MTRKAYTLRPEHLGRILFVAFGLTIACFLTSTLVAELAGWGIRNAADNILTVSSESVYRLASARTEVRKLEVLLDDYMDSAEHTGHPRAGGAEQIGQARQRLDQAWRDYLSLPTYSGEKELWPPLEERFTALGAAVDEVVVRVERGDTATARQILDGRTKSTIDRLDEALMRLGAFDAEQGRRLASGIGVLWRRSVLLAVVLGSLSAILAITAGVLAARIIRRDSDLLRRRSAELENFAGRVSHDLVAPLGALLLTLEVAARKSEPELQAMLDKGSRSVRRVSQVVEAMLAFARAGAQPDPDARADAKQVVGAVVEEVRPAARQHGIAVRCDIDRELEVACRPGILSSAVSNLVENAIKYMGDAPVREVTIRAGQRRSMAVFFVEDTGPGVPPELRETIFEPYTRADRTGRSGIGLGLATVKRMCEAHGGRVGVEPRPGGGSRFWIELPKAA